MSVNNFDELLNHLGHNISIHTYNDKDGNPQSVTIECEDCYEVLLYFDKEESNDVECPDCGNTDNFHINYDWSVNPPKIESILCNECGRIFKNK